MANLIAFIHKFRVLAPRRGICKPFHSKDFNVPTLEILFAILQAATANVPTWIDLCGSGACGATDVTSADGRMKPLRWIASAKDDLSAMPTRCAGPSLFDASHTSVGTYLSASGQSSLSLDKSPPLSDEALLDLPLPLQCGGLGSSTMTQLRQCFAAFIS